MSKEQFKYPLRDIDDYIKEYIGNFNAFEYNENKDIETIKKEHNVKKFMSLMLSQLIRNKKR